MYGQLKGNPGELAVCHSLLFKLYDLTFAIQEDSTFTKDDVLNSIQSAIKDAKELLELLEAH